jgi:hypothetical protein
MTTPREPDHLFAAWMSEGPATLRDEVLASISTEILRTPQRRGLRSRWTRLPIIARAAAVAVAAVAAVAIGITGVRLLGIGAAQPSVGGPGPVATASPSPSPSATAVTSWTMESTAYGYSWTFPADVVSMKPTPATIPWGGETPCIVQDACSDWMGLKGEPGTADRLLWAFGTPTDLDRDAFDADMRNRMSTWRGCPVESEIARDITLDGTPARIHAFTCPSGDATDLHVRVYAVRDGVGLVISMAKPDSGEPLVAADEIDRLLGYLEAFRWTP